MTEAADSSDPSSFEKLDADLKQFDLGSEDEDDLLGNYDDADIEFDDDTVWHINLETALLDGCDFGTLRTICNNRPLSERVSHLRQPIWKICLNISSSPHVFEDAYNLPQQSAIRQDCHQLADEVGSADDAKITLVSDVESIITQYCKTYDVEYKSSRYWTEILKPLVALNLPKSDTYSMLSAVLRGYIPAQLAPDSAVYHLFRLLLLYHDPKMCSFFDSKNIRPEHYAQTWFGTLFAKQLGPQVLWALWDLYFMQADSFLVFFLSLAILSNAKDQIMETEEMTREQMLQKLIELPGGLEVADVTDFVSIAHFYMAKTPNTFRSDYHFLFTGLSTKRESTSQPAVLGQALCLPLSATELLRAAQFDTGSNAVGFFAIDCRPAEQYNSGHLSTAVHLDSSLLLESPREFDTAVDAMLDYKDPATTGEHICFIGSGRDDEDKYLHMVVSKILQRNIPYISILNGGYLRLHQEVSEHIEEAITDHVARSCLACTAAAAAQPPSAATKTFSMFGQLKDRLTVKGSELKDKVAAALTQEKELTHVKPNDDGRPYRGLKSAFQLDDGDSTTGQAQGDKDLVPISVWLNKPDVRHSYDCQLLSKEDQLRPGYLLVTDSHVYLLERSEEQPDMALVRSRRRLDTIMKITAKRQFPECVSFKYGYMLNPKDDQSEVNITHIDRAVIKSAGEATTAVKMQIIKLLKMEGDS